MDLPIERLFFPALRWDTEHGFGPLRASVDRALEIGVGGFILFGGRAEDIRELTAELHERSRVPLLIGADLERGAGQQFRHAVALPPPAVLGEMDDLAHTRRAGEITAREARALGINWVYAPVADLDIEPANPIVGSRAFGSDPDHVARHVAAWIDGCRAGGALSCAKHFPGHGRTTSDSHLELPSVEIDRETLAATDLVPFRAAIREGVDSIMTAHVAYPSLDPSGAPATLSRPIIGDLLRRELDYDGLVITDALIMEGVLKDGAGEAEAGVQAVAAGCDALLYPGDLEAVVVAVRSAVGRDLDENRVRSALDRIERAAERVGGPPAGAWSRREDQDWALDTASRALRVVRGRPVVPAGEPIEVLTIDDDVGGPYNRGLDRTAFGAALLEAGVRVREVEALSGDAPAVVALYADIKGFKGRPGLSADAKTALGRIFEAQPDALVVLFGHPRLAAEVPGDGPVLSAWGGETLMQEAAALWLSDGV